MGRKMGVRETCQASKTFIIGSQQTFKMDELINGNTSKCNKDIKDKKIRYYLKENFYQKIKQSLQLYVNMSEFPGS